jgi:hypothetical protein
MASGRIIPVPALSNGDLFPVTVSLISVGLMFLLISIRCSAHSTPSFNRSASALS